MPELLTLILGIIVGIVTNFLTDYLKSIFAKQRRKISHENKPDNSNHSRLPDGSRALPEDDKAKIENSGSPPA